MRQRGSGLSAGSHGTRASTGTYEIMQIPAFQSVPLQVPNYANLRDLPPLGTRTCPSRARVGRQRPADSVSLAWLGKTS